MLGICVGVLCLGVLFGILVEIKLGLRLRSGSLIKREATGSDAFFCGGGGCKNTLGDA